MQTNGGHPRSGGGDGGGATAHSGLSSATAFLQTPAAGAQAQRRLPPLTPTAELGAERGASSAAAAPAVPASAPAPPAAPPARATPAGAAPACCPAPARDRGPTLAAPCAKRAVPAGGTTDHSLASGSSGGTGGSASGAPSGAEEATATLHSGPARAATPATGAALAAASLSSSCRCKAIQPAICSFCQLKICLIWQARRSQFMRRPQKQRRRVAARVSGSSHSSDGRCTWVMQGRGSLSQAGQWAGDA